jgi:hypothetical protein
MLREGGDPARADALAQRQTLGRHFGFVVDWPNRYDYVVMLDFGVPVNPLPGRLAPMHSGSFFTIYAIAR